jgi:hypothetical protein
MRPQVGLVLLFVSGLLLLAHTYAQDLNKEEGIADVQISASPLVLTRSGQNVTVSWSGLPRPNVHDFVAFYSPANRPDLDYIGFKSVTQSIGWQDGSGSLTFTMVNMRSSFNFRLWSCTSAKNCRAIATSNNVTFASLNEPQQGHLSLTRDPHEMRVMWVSLNGSKPCVQYGTSPYKLTNRAYGTSASYTRAQLCTSPANLTTNFISPGQIHTVLLSNLGLNTIYYYRFGDGSNFNDEGLWSDTFSFRTSPGVGRDQGVHFIAYGDLGVNPPWPIRQEIQGPSGKTVKWVLRDLASEPKPSLVLHVGDISYARGYAYLWELFFHQVQPIATQVPYMVCIGNHEYDYVGQPWKPDWADYGTDSGGECGIPYNSRFMMPGLAPESRNLWYSFDYGNIHFVFMSSEHNFLVGSEQWKFLENDLRSVDRSKTPWVIFSGHRPMYTSSELGRDIGVNKHLRDNIEPLLIKYGVNLCLWGHVHQYERTCGLQNFTCAESDNDRPVHVVVGMGGNSWQVSWGNHGTGENYQPDWSIFRSMNWGYSHLWTNATHLRFQYLGDQRGEVHDQFWLVQKDH